MARLKITDYRDPNGRFAKRKRVKQNRRIVLLLILIAAGIVVYQARKQDIPLQPKQEITEGITAEQQARLDKQYELSKQETILNNKKDKLQAEINEIEAQLETIRAEKMSFK